MRFDVVGVGRACIDYFFEFNCEASPPKQLIPRERWFAQGGGSIPTALAALARWRFGALFIGKIGDDTHGEKIRAELEDFGVTTRLTTTPGCRTPVSVIKLASGDGVLEHYSFQEDEGLLLTPTETASLLSALEPPRFLLTDCHHLQAELDAVRWASSRGVPVVLDPGDTAIQGFGAADLKAFFDLIKYVTFVVASRRFTIRFADLLDREGVIQAGTGRSESTELRMMRFLATRGPTAVIVTRAREDTLGFSVAEGDFRCPVPEAELRDPTGSGDVFHAAFMAFLLRGTGPFGSLREATRFANAAAALSCRGLGARRSIPKLDEVEALMRQ